jgi:pilus assembly protein CpaC
MIPCKPSSWALAAVLAVALPAVSLPALFASSSVLAGEKIDPDTVHTGSMKIGFDEPLPVRKNVLIGANKTMMIEVPRDLRDVVVSNPEMLDAVVQTSNRVFLVAKKIAGESNVFLFDENGEQIAQIEVRIEEDMNEFNRLVERLIPGARIRAEVLNDTMVLSGSVISPADSAKASEIAARFMNRPAESNGTAPAKVINLLKVEAKEQVMLKVTVAEVQREQIKRFGVNWAGGSIGDSAIGFGTTNGYPASGTGGNSILTGVVGPSNNLGSCAGGLIPSPVAGAASAINCLAAQVSAFERAGLLKTLAEPNLTAISGETATFLAGGEFPVPVGSKDGEISIQFKPFGVGLSFTPLVQSEGSISLKLSSEVSELSSEGAITIGNGTFASAIPGLKVRRTTTTVELPSGGSLMIGGLISDDTRANIDGLPGLKTLPILGSLFRSSDFKKKETELVVIVTPYIVNAVATSDLALPTTGLDPATDTQAHLLGQLNAVYGKEEKLPEGQYHGKYGFIVE